MENSIYALLPPLIAIIMVVLTRKILLSLGVGIIASAFMLADFKFGETAAITWDAAKGIFISDGALNLSNIYIIAFLLLLGVITVFISVCGGSRAFGEWAMKRVKTKTGAQLVAAVLGILIFIDDYFNALAVGQIARPITDRQKVSRAKLAYIIDSSSAPICVISPVSSWGAYIIALLGIIFAQHQYTEYGAFTAFLQMSVMNYYAIAAIAMVFIVAFRSWNIGSMKVHENRAALKGELFDPAKSIPGELKEKLETSRKGSVYDLIVPILTLIIGTVAAMIWTGFAAVSGKVTVLTVLENTDVTKSLVIGGLLGLIAALIMFAKQVFYHKAINGNVFGKSFVQGIVTMLPAVYILLLAWMLVDLISRLQVGAYLAGLVQQSNLPIAFLPIMLFLVAGIMTFATGTSWGSFGILLPIAGEIAVATDAAMMLPAMAAVLAGAVFGDHCSPISDTTILSATGAGSNLIDHVMTQLPYALICAVVSMVGYVVLGLTENMWISLLVVLGLIGSLLMVRKPSSEAEPKIDNSLIDS
ncbi:Na+/H+ antiporter NhaC family protein [Pradoshia sp.]